MFTPNNGDRGDVGNHVILVTDGSSNIRVGAAVTMAIDMRVDGAKITVLGVGSNANTLELRGKAGLFKSFIALYIVIHILLAICTD